MPAHRRRCFWTALSLGVLGALPASAADARCSAPIQPASCASQQVTIQGDYNVVENSCVVHNICQLVLERSRDTWDQDLERVRQKFAEFEQTLNRIEVSSAAAVTKSDRELTALAGGQLRLQSDVGQLRTSWTSLGGAVRAAKEQLRDGQRAVLERLEALHWEVRRQRWWITLLGGAGVAVGGAVLELVVLAQQPRTGNDINACMTKAGMLYCHEGARDDRRVLGAVQLLGHVGLGLGLAAVGVGWLGLSVDADPSLRALTWTATSVW